MTVLLRASGDPAQLPDHDFQAGVLAARPAGTMPHVPNLGKLLDDAFHRTGVTWFETAKRLADTPGGELSDTLSCAPNISDFGEMLAWSDVVRAWAMQEATVLVVCDDPWMFRHLASLSGVKAGKPPQLFGRTALKYLRGALARLRFAVSAGLSVIARRSKRSAAAHGGPWLLSYAHPTSDATGRDAYFGSLMDDGRVWRVLHVHNPEAGSLAERAEKASPLQAWGSAIWALRHLPFALWRPGAGDVDGTHGWLIRRAQVLEASRAQAALSAWQMHCQKRWLERQRPTVVAWLWENHSWERALCRDARALGVRTIGYQHSVVGPVMYNYAARSNPDGADSLPDVTACTGESTRRQLQEWGMDPQTLRVAGALRQSTGGRVQFDPAGPLLVALPFDRRIGDEMITAVAAVGAALNRPVLVKAHPVYAHALSLPRGVCATDRTLDEHESLGAVVFAATTVGLEAALMGLPTVRFLPRGHVAVDITPDSTPVPAADSDGLEAAIRQAQKTPPVLERDFFFDSPDHNFWHIQLSKGDE